MRKRPERLQMRLTGSELLAIMRAARESKLRPSTWARGVLVRATRWRNARNEVVRTGQPPTVE